MAFALKRWTGTVDETLLVAGDQPDFRVSAWAGSPATLGGLVPRSARRPSVASRHAVWVQLDMASGQRAASPWRISARVDGVSVPLDNVPDITSFTRLYFYSPSWKNRPLNSFSVSTEGYVPGAAGSTVTIPGEANVAPPLGPNGRYYYPRAFQQRIRPRGVPGTGWSTWTAAPASDVGPDAELFYAAQYTASVLAQILSSYSNFDYEVRGLSWAAASADQAGRTRNDSPVIRWTPPRTVTTGATNGIVAVGLRVGYFD